MPFPHVTGTGQSLLQSAQLELLPAGPLLPTPLHHCCHCCHCCRLLSVGQRPGRDFFQRLASKLEEYSVATPTVQIEYRNLTVRTQAMVGSAGIPTVGSFGPRLIKVKQRQTACGTCTSGLCLGLCVGSFFEFGDHVYMARLYESVWQKPARIVCIVCIVVSSRGFKHSCQGMNAMRCSSGAEAKHSNPAMVAVGGCRCTDNSMLLLDAIAPLMSVVCSLPWACVDTPRSSLYWTTSMGCSSRWVARWQHRTPTACSK